MRNLLFLPIAVAFLALPWPAGAATDPLTPLFAKMDASAANFRGLKAGIRRAAHTAVINEDSVETGTIVVKRSGRELHMRIDILQPDPQQIVISRNKAEIFHPQTNTMDVYDFARKYRSLVETFLLLGFGTTSNDLRNAYVVTYGGPEIIDGQKTERIELVPKSKEMLAQFPKIELWISDTLGVAIQQKLYSRGGDYNLATYTGLKLSRDISEDEVTLKPPKGAVLEYPLK